MTPPIQRSSTPRDFPSGTLAWDPVARAPAAEDRLVGAAFAFLTDPQGLSPDRARELGRALGRQAKETELALFLEAFAHLGLGALRVAGEGADRFTFASSDLRGAERPKAPACALALGFSEGVAHAPLGGAMLGAETRCRSRGHEECVFVVMRKR